MGAITVYIDDSAEERRRRRRRWIEIAILLALIPLLPLFSSGKTRLLVVNPPVITTTESPDPVVIYRSLDSQNVPPPPRLAVEPHALDFGTRGVGRGSPARMVTIRNEGGFSLKVSLQSTGNDFLIADTCADPAPCAAAVVFMPSGEGRRRGELRVSGGGETKRVQLSGFASHATSGFPPPPPPPPPSRCAQNVQPRIDPPRIHFFGGGRRTIMISNPHPCPLRVTAIDLMNADHPESLARGYKLDGEAACKAILQPGGRCAFDVATTFRYTLHATVRVTSSVVTTP